MGAGAGREFGKYRLVEELGHGGMGVVWKAWDTVLSRHIALKLLLGGRHLGPDILARFLREARAAAKLRHPGIVSVLEVGEHEGEHYLVTEYVKGETLSELLKTPIPMRRAVEIVVALAAALDHAHRNGIVHRDVKPGNILLDHEGQPRILDFGLAKDLFALPDAAQTQSGAFLGTPRYMSPEQAEGRRREIGPASDQFSLGVVFYELLTGCAPFRGDSIGQLLDAIRACQPAPPEEIRPGIPSGLSQICLRSLAKRARSRYPTIGDFGAELAHWLTTGEVRTEIQARGRRRQVSRAQPMAKRPSAPRSLGVAGVLLAIMGIGAIAGAMWLSREREGGRPGAGGGVPDPSRRTEKDGEPAPAHPPPIEVDDPARQFSLAVRSRPPGALASIVFLDSATLVREDEPRELGPTPLGPIAFDLEHEGGARFLVLVRGVERSVSLPRTLVPEERRLPPVEIDVDLDELDPGEVLVEDGPDGAFALSMDETTAGDYELEAARWDLARPVVPPGDRGLPVRGLSWYDAWLYAVLEGRRLPTSEEWELAAFGPWRAAYPHGHGLGPLAAIQSDYLASWLLTPKLQAMFPQGVVLATRLRPPGSRPEDLGPYGARDMGFNLQEWTASSGHHEATYGEWTPIVRGVDYLAPWAESSRNGNAHLSMDFPASIGISAAGVRTCRSLLPRMWPRSLGSLAELVELHETVGVRTAALVQLAALSDPGVPDVLATFLADPEPEVRARALFLLAARAFSQRAMEAAETGLADSDPRVRFLSLALLRVARRGGSAVARAVSLLSDPVPAVRRGAIGYLASVAPTPESIGEISDRLGKYADFDTRAARALAARLPDARVAALLAGEGNRDPFATELVLTALLLPPTSPELADARAALGFLGRGTCAARLAADILDAAADRPGVVGRYYSGSDLGSPLLTRIDAAPDHSWRGSPPDPGLPADSVGVRWVGFLRVDEPGEYVFEAYVDDGLRLSIDRRPLIDNFGHGFRTIHRSLPMRLDAGLHPIVAETVDHWGDALFHLFWSKDGGERQAVPAGNFFHSAGQARALGAG